MKKLFALGGLALLLLAGWGYPYHWTVRMDRQMNAALVAPPYHPSAAAAALHQRLFIADMHADSLLWERGIGSRSARGQVDLPRMLEPNQALRSSLSSRSRPSG